MLTMTDTAVDVVSTIAKQAEGDQTAGLRISSAQDGGDSLAVAVASAPEQSDSVVEAGEARIFLEEAVVPALDDKVLDAQVESDGSVRFAIGQQPA